MISIYPVLHNKKQYLDLLLLADEQESMIDRYLERGEMFVLTDAGNIKAACVVTREAEDVFEIKNIATYPQFQRQGYGRILNIFSSGMQTDAELCSWVRATVL